MQGRRQSKGKGQTPLGWCVLNTDLVLELGFSMSQTHQLPTWPHRSGTLVAACLAVVSPAGCTQTLLYTSPLSPLKPQQF